jgi:Lipopolysaccharide-assembly
MILRNNVWVLIILLLSGCGIYSFTGANVQGKTINVTVIQNNAPIVAPSLSVKLTEKVRNKILNQTSLSQVNSDKTDYNITGTILGYDVSIASLNTQSVSTNRLTIKVEIIFANNVDTKKSFTRTYSKFGDFDGNKTLQQAESVLIDQICSDLADVIFNDAFVNW